jgi:hypothetical protein
MEDEEGEKKGTHDAGRYRENNNKGNPLKLPRLHDPVEYTKPLPCYVHSNMDFADVFGTALNIP